MTPDNEVLTKIENNTCENEKTNKGVHAIRIIIPIIVFVIIVSIFRIYSLLLEKQMIQNAEFVTKQMAESVSTNISNTVDYAESSIKSVAVSVSQTMTSKELDNPSDIILPMIENTPFESIEYIRSDGMNVMNIGNSFDASDRVYYTEGIKGNSGIWNNYHPKMLQETLINFYTPLYYGEEIAGVITGYIAANTQVTPLLETQFYGEEVYGILIDENEMVICSTFDGEYKKDMTLDMLFDSFDISEEQRRMAKSIFSEATGEAVVFYDHNGDGRVCVRNIENTDWKVVIIVPASSFSMAIGKSTRYSLAATILVGIVVMLYATYVILRNVNERRRMAVKNAILEKDNRIYNEENQKAFKRISEIKDIIASANMGTWRIELVDNEEPRMFVDDTMKNLLGISGQEHTPEKTYNDWFENITEEAIPSVLSSVERMEQGYFDENTYLWKHPTKGIRYVRCGGTAKKIDGGFSLRGYHYDVDDVVRKEQKQFNRLQKALNDKKEYYSMLGAMGDIYYSVHVINLKDNTAVEYNAKNEVKDIVNRKDGAMEMMRQIMSTVIADEYKEMALEFSDLSTLPERMQGKKVINKQLVGKHIGWFVASFIAMETDKKGRPTKVIFTSRNNDEEKRQEERLINKAQTDELTGVYNRRAYEETLDVIREDGMDDGFTYISFDVNGLKVVNDSIGHEAGDELIVGACECIKRAFGNVGKIYRTGGDEFVAIVYADNDSLKRMEKNLEDNLLSFSGVYVDSVSLSYGIVAKSENPDWTLHDIAILAEKRMYEAKTDHYRKTGVDRRGQQDAHKTLCQLYTKILKINITDDTYQIVNMDSSEQTDEKGFANTISKWLRGFGEAGQVHPDDLEEYLRLTDLDYMKDYFNSNKTSLHIIYRRKFGEEFKQVMMEIVPATDYSADEQNLFLYVKNIDK